jgi:hypothetical protein
MPVTMPDSDIACSLLGATPSWPASALTEGDEVVPREGTARSNICYLSHPPVLAERIQIIQFCVSSPHFPHVRQPPASRAGTVAQPAGCR